MVHHVKLIHFKPGTTPEQVESFLVESRIRLLKIPEVMNLRCGKKIDVKGNPYDVVVTIEFENMAKLNIAHDSDVYVKYEKQILDTFVAKSTTLNFEMEPGKDVNYS